MNNIEIYDSNLTAADVKNNPLHVACRGVVLKDGKILTVRVAKYDITMLPGGGLEEGETLEDCAKREVAEETGIVVDVKQETVRVTEHYEGHSYLNIYFICDYVNDTKRTNYTQEEKDLEMEIVWRDPDELLELLTTNMTLHEYGPNIHNREFLGVIHSL